MNTRVLVTFATAAAALSLAGAALASSQTQALSVLPLEVQAARVSGKASVGLKRPIKPGHEKTEPVEDYEDAATGERYWVEKATQKVRRYSNPDAMSSRGPELSEAAMAILAESKLRQLCDNERFSHMKREVAEHPVEALQAGEHRLVEPQFSFNYRECIDGVETFNYVYMDFAPDGSMATLNMQDEPVTVSLLPSISDFEAIEIAAKALQFERRSGQRAHLAVNRQPETGVQRLCWAVDLTTGDRDFGAKGFGLVDATDGTVLDLAVAY